MFSFSYSGLIHNSPISLYSFLKYTCGSTSSSVNNIFNFILPGIIFTYLLKNYVGIDIGSTASKVVTLGDKITEFVLPTGWSSKETVDEIKSRLLSYDIDVDDNETKIVATGYGRISVDFADKIITGTSDIFRISFSTVYPEISGSIRSRRIRSTFCLF